MTYLQWLADNPKAVAALLTKAPKHGDTMAWLRWGLGLLSLLKHDTISMPGLPAAPAPKKEG